MTRKNKKTGVVEKIIEGGWGLIRDNDGVVLLNYVLPGEKVEYYIKEKAKNISWGRVLEVKEVSEHRIKPECKYYGKCGGCIFQHISYEYQKKIKQEIFVENLTRIGNYRKDIDEFIESPPFNYRIRVQLKCDDKGKLGFIKKGTNTIIPVDKCLLVRKKVNRLLNSWNSFVSPAFFHQIDLFENIGEKKVYIHLSHSPDRNKNEFLGNFSNDYIFSWKKNYENGVSEINIKNNKYLVSPACFFQVNYHLWEKMLSVVEEYLSKEEKIIDLYTGVGFFLPVLKKYSTEIIGVENHDLSAKIAKRVFPEVKIVKTNAEKFYFEEADILLVDPPRPGLSKKVMKKILKKMYKKIIYVSCSSVSFSRDSSILIDEGYELRKLKLLDLFPQTPHIESIALFIK